MRDQISSSPRGQHSSAAIAQRRAEAREIVQLSTNKIHRSSETFYYDALRNIYKVLAGHA